jgi:ornithine carbamoyltransferase
MNPMETLKPTTKAPSASYHQPHFLTGEEWSAEQLQEILNLAATLKKERQQGILRPLLNGKTIVLLFDKPSLRTRLSFSVAINELGGHTIESIGSSRKTEEPEDVIRVLAGYAHGLMIRTFDHAYIERMAQLSPIPIINGLTDSHHPCQVMADLLTLQERFTNLKGLRLAYIGDGNNMLHSLMLLCPRLGIELHYACPVGYEPNAFIVKTSKQLAQEGGGSITAHATPESAATMAHALYTDVWTSMGFEHEEMSRESAFEGYQINEALLAKADPKAIVMHCMPMVRGKEISQGLPDHSQSAIFQQSENRLHVQKAILAKLLGKA